MNDSERVEERAGWDHDPGESPKKNMRRLVEAVPPEVSDGILVDVAFRSIAGLGPESARKVLASLREERDEE